MMRPWRQVFGEVLFWTGLVIMILGGIGEFVGWWNDAGVVVVLLGGVLSLVGTFAAVWSIFDINGRAILRTVNALDRGMRALASSLGGLHAKQDGMLGKQDAMLDKQDAMLAKQDLAMDRFDHMVRLQGEVRDLLDERLPPAGGP